MLAAKIRGNEGGVIGVRIIAQDNEEQNVLRRFWNSGMKMNSFRANGEDIGITFEDLELSEVMLCQKKITAEK